MSSIIRGSDDFDTATVGVNNQVSVATTSGTSIDFTGIPSGAKRVTVNMAGVSTSGVSELQIQIGDSGGVETTAYTGGSYFIAGGTAGARSYVTGGSAGFWWFNSAVAAHVRDGNLKLMLQDEGSNTWNGCGSFGVNNDLLFCSTAGVKSLSGVLDRLRLTTVNGTDTFDAGSVSISWEL